ncbi:MAG: UDP-N-acetylmuramoyl-L-alanyl-D-glutamate--2,6-diaminopimelate ligase [Burkholderiales bacterium]|nr:UDP-N-acetylmuramoyl-L-alanyl-D-glutamate--2,6-diaminopimelate ligase [Burkholderiales bacterium]
MANNMALLQFIQQHAPVGAKLRLDSRQVQPGDVFFAVKGSKADGSTFMQMAASNGASCIVAESQPTIDPGIPVLVVEDLRGKLAEIASAYYEEPSKNMIGIAVTGTNGKTTVTHWIGQLLTKAGIPCAVIGTIGCTFKGEKLDIPPLTTPDVLSLEGILSDLRKEGCKAFAMEASSIGLVQGRMAGLHLKTAIFTNLSQDHLDYHGTMQKYEEAKAILFSWPGLENAVVDIDHEAGLRFRDRAKARGLNLITCSVKSDADLKATDIVHTASTLEFTLNWKNQARKVSAQFVGLFNVENCLCAVAACLLSGVSFEELCNAVPTLKSPNGRMEKVEVPGKPLVVIDYSHTPDALIKAMDGLADLKQQRNAEMWVVIGAGGDRDKTKRPLMGKAAALSEHPVLTSDNPRTENPQTILDEVAEGAKEAVKILDRAQAIRYAIHNAKPQDIVLIAGKGHEDYQEINGVKTHFLDAEEARKALNECGGNP